MTHEQIDTEALKQTAAMLPMQSRETVERMAWDLQDAMAESKPMQVAVALAAELKDSGEFTDEEIEAAKAHAFLTIVNG